MPETAPLFVATDAAGPPPDGGARARTADELLDALGERIFAAERGSDGAVVVGAELAWDAPAAAAFALDCVEHAVTDADVLQLPSGFSLGDVLRAARTYLATEESFAEEDGVLHRLSRLAHTRKIRRLGDQVADLAYGILRDDEEKDLDALDDAAFTAVAAVRDAVIAVVEAIRDVALPHLSSVEERRYDEERTDDAQPQLISTGWGDFRVGRSHVAPAAASAGDAAERARQSVADQDGEEAGRAERAWQVAHLEEVLRRSG